jgi:hypothetical protein
MTGYAVCVGCGRAWPVDPSTVLYGQATPDGQFACEECINPYDEQEEEQ